MNENDVKPSIKESFRIANVHQWLRYHYGKSNRCENKHCSKKSKFFDYSLIVGKKHEKNRNNYQMLCRSCHFKYDLKHGMLNTQKEILRQSGIKYGANNGMVMCKFSISQARYIRRCCANGIKQKKLADKFNVVPSCISHIVNNRTYKEEKYAKA